MPDPLAVEQTSLREIIRELEQEYQNLHDANAQISADGLHRLQALREQLDEAQAKRSRSEAFALTKEVLAKLAVEVMWKLVEISIRRFFAVYQRIRESIDAACRRGHSLFATG